MDKISRTWLLCAFVACAQQPNNTTAGPADKTSTTGKAHASNPHANKSMMKPTTPKDVTLSWKMTRNEKAIEVRYRIENRSKTRIYVCDKLLVRIQKTKLWRAFPGVSLQNLPGSTDTAQIVVGTPATDIPSFTIPPVLFKTVEPGQVFEDKRELRLPLTSYNVMGMTDKLNRSIKKAVLIVHAFVGDPKSWRELPGEEGTIRVPDEFTAQDLVSEPLPIP